MNIELDWQIADEGEPPEQPAQLPVPRPRRHLPRRWLIASAAILAIIIVIAAGYVIVTYRQQLERAERGLHPVVKLETQAIAANDRTSFLALQDPEDAAWRALQEKRFGQLERIGWPEFGWKATGIAPKLGSVTLEPGGARLDVTYQFSVTEPLPDGPTRITLRVPQYYKPTPSGWVRAMPGADFWGTWRKLRGKSVVVVYLQRDASVIEPLAPLLDEIMQRICDPLACPVLLPITFEGTTDSLSGLNDFSYGYDYTGLKLPSPHLIGLPADAPSRQELYRAYETRLVQALIYQASDRRLNMTYLSSKEFVRWELAQAGLAGPYLGEAITRTLITAPAVARQPLGAISLRWRSLGLGPAPGEVVMPLAFDFLEQQFGSGTVVRLLPAIISSRISTLGEAINLTLRVNPATLEPAWQRYLRERSELLPVAKPVLSPPGGELALGCTITRNLFSIWRIRADGTGVIQAMDSQSFIRPIWSPDGKLLAFLQNEHAFVVEAESQRTRAIREGYRYQGIGWLPDGRLRLDEPGGFESSVRAINLDSGQDVQITGTNPTWSPDGQWMTYLTTQYPTTQTIWLAEANGQDARPLVSGYAAAWSPGGTRLAFVSGPMRGSPPFGTGPLQLNQISIVDITSGTVRELARASDLIPSSTGNYGIGSIGNLTWSPDGTMLAVALSQQNSATLSVLSTDSGTVLTRWRGANARWIKSSWSQDNHYLAFGAQVGSGRNVTSAIGLLDNVTGETVTVPGRDFDWSPDGKWLAIPQEPSGVLLVTPDFATMRWLDTPNCMNIAWRPNRGG